MTTTVASPVNDRVVLHNVGWETYERLLTDLKDCSSLRLTYDQGTLEIMSPSEKHEELNRALATLVDILIEELDLEARSLGSSTFRRFDLKRGFEPDSCFYVQNAERVLGKDKIDLTTDPPPDLVIEVDLESSSQHEMSIYARLGVPEVWRYEGGAVRIHTLGSNGYEESEFGLAFPILSAKKLSELLKEAETTKRSRWLRSIREWLRSAETGRAAE